MQKHITEGAPEETCLSYYDSFMAAMDLSYLSTAQCQHLSNCSGCQALLKGIEASIEHPKFWEVLLWKIGLADDEATRCVQQHIQTDGCRACSAMVQEAEQVATILDLPIRFAKWSTGAIVEWVKNSCISPTLNSPVGAGASCSIASERSPKPLVVPSARFDAAITQSADGRIYLEVETADATLGMKTIDYVMTDQNSPIAGTMVLEPLGESAWGGDVVIEPRKQYSGARIWLSVAG